MLDYARQRAIEALKIPRRAVLATSGPAGLQASEMLCEAIGLTLYLLAPETSDHLFNLEQNPAVTVVTSHWELSGTGQVVSPLEVGHKLGLLGEPGAEWCALVRVCPKLIQIRQETGWGFLESIEL